MEIDLDDAAARPSAMLATMQQAALLPTARRCAVCSARLRVDP